ncbi:hypothetical protein NL676_036595 [Syzygium grande]|nr:hypothetical protein NL676_036595 [Syzygium grande]
MYIIHGHFSSFPLFLFFFFFFPLVGLPLAGGVSDDLARRARHLARQARAALARHRARAALAADRASLRPTPPAGARRQIGGEACGVGEARPRWAGGRAAARRRAWLAERARLARQKGDEPGGVGKAAFALLWRAASLMGGGSLWLPA